MGELPADGEVEEGRRGGRVILKLAPSNALGTELGSSGSAVYL
jgi:hypothetical protein